MFDPREWPVGYCFPSSPILAFDHPSSCYMPPVSSLRNMSQPAQIPGMHRADGGLYAFLEDGREAINSEEPRTPQRPSRRLPKGALFPAPPPVDRVSPFRLRFVSLPPGMVEAFSPPAYVPSSSVPTRTQINLDWDTQSQRPKIDWNHWEAFMRRHLEKRRRHEYHRGPL